MSDTINERAAHAVALAGLRSAATTLSYMTSQVTCSTDTLRAALDDVSRAIRALRSGR